MKNPNCIRWATNAKDVVKRKRKKAEIKAKHYNQLMKQMTFHIIKIQIIAFSQKIKRKKKKYYKKIKI